MASASTSSITPDDDGAKLKVRARDIFSTSHGTQDGMEIQKMMMKVEHKSVEDKVQKMSLGQKTNRPTKVILMVGATGTGKTTLINAMVNFIYRVEFTDKFRLVLIDDKNAPKRSQAESQTDMITAYAFYQLPGMPFEYNYVLIDTPGFGDTRGIQRDREMMSQLESFLKQDYGIDQVDGVGFVTPASAARLTQTQRYVYDGLSSMFGKDIKDNIYVMATFADANTPPVLDALKEAGVHYSGFYKFNNSALYACNATADNDADDSDSDDEDSSYINKLFWEMGYRSLQNFFLKLGKTSPVSLTLTKQVLEERSRLQVVVIGLQNQINLGLIKLSNLNQERDMLARLDDDMKGSANYEEEVEVSSTRKIKLSSENGEDGCAIKIPKIIDIDLTPKEFIGKCIVNILKKFKIGLSPKVNVTNCVKCNMTCHYPCPISDDNDKAKCWAITNGYCRICPGNCSWDLHKNMSFRYEHTSVKETRTVQELLDRYQKAKQNKLTKEGAIQAIEQDINDHAQMLIDLIQEAQRHVERLEEIALKPNPLSTKEYIDLMIESEKMQKRHNFMKRIKMLEKLKEEVVVIQGVRGNCNKASGESLLKYFHDLVE
ncbi:uncharacterized protein LOC121872899 isoform X2 [Homarus americanus]|uniref:Putative 50S ribosome-binding GTPase-like 2 n=1 Tax=Homarus americanus TaxID=6706 RepID=A0A8J5JVV5_HOMAM|nr:uncharacterized protein LOC121872899 isoform X2 [Homarus americanus]KAG7163271.1 putative 50S ribosome-binding GTPase-like 2 [Homarus americanus]